MKEHQDVCIGETTRRLETRMKEHQDVCIGETTRRLETRIIRNTKMSA